MSPKKTVPVAGIQKSRKSSSLLDEIERQYGGKTTEARKLCGGIILYLVLSYFVIHKSNPSLRSEIISAYHSTMNDILFKPGPEWLMPPLTPILAICFLVKNQQIILFRESRIAIFTVCFSDLIIRTVKCRFGPFENYAAFLHIVVLLDFFIVGVVASYAKCGLLFKANRSRKLIVSMPQEVETLRWIGGLPHLLAVPEGDNQVWSTTQTVDLFLKISYASTMCIMGIHLGNLFVRSLIGIGKQDEDPEDSDSE